MRCLLRYSVSLIPGVIAFGRRTIRRARALLRRSGSAREADFRSFLEKHFTKVTVADLSKFKEEQAKRARRCCIRLDAYYDGKGGH